MWDIKAEEDFFINALNNKFASPETLFYKIGKDFFAYIPKGKSSNGNTLQSRNSLIGKYTEVWVKDLINPIAEKLGLYAINEVICDEISLTSQSPADVALCTTNHKHQNPKNIKVIFEVKMSIVSNFSYDDISKKIIYLGGYNCHRGVPSILRSDSMLKAIGKAVNIRVSSEKSNNIPIIVLGNTPITNSYLEKVDMLKQFGICQGFWSLNPSIANDENIISKSKNQGFITLSNIQQLELLINKILKNNLVYFSGMYSKTKLGEIIAKANLFHTYEDKAEEFLKLLRGNN